MKPVLPKGHLSCFSPAFKYTPAANTDIKATFARIREQLEKQQREADDHVTPMRQRRKP